ncbi:PepSY domain-containing protein [Paenactinomyces guangxiensis]|uniref:Uncharacterized protein n=1 Tax=Paenactinomyces guangxiensis TaxID=1490290 RepID=A0A7W1WN49_9BACL|nr:hypothetical protein [Paenactinomyces guangxiensis]MBA4492951.1 hypothetical protein [Paenactinomyces guangxiensis]MBH8590200.1 hypothetical protein [Paenactinomyces guangxiensis]
MNRTKVMKAIIFMLFLSIAIFLAGSIAKIIDSWIGDNREITAAPRHHQSIEQESINDSGPEQKQKEMTPTTYDHESMMITAEEAARIALEKAPGKVRIEKVELERKDGVDILSHKAGRKRSQGRSGD